jgi:hypothetical protein
MFWKRQIPLAIAFGVGVAMLVQYYVPHNASQELLSMFSTWAMIIGAFALAIGLSSLLHMHVGKIRRMVPGWGYSMVTIVALIVTAGIGVYAGWQRPAPGEPVYGMNAPQIQWMYMNLMWPLGGTMFSILAFFIASAAYRAFRARTFEATVLLVAAMIVMLEVVPIGIFAAIGVPEINNWIFTCPNMAAQRGIMMGVALSIVATSLRIIFGIERTYLGGGD